MNSIAWHPFSGCSHHSPGCLNCYAMAPDFAHDGLTDESKRGPIWNGKLQWNGSQLSVPLKAAKGSHFAVCPHGDLFHENAIDEWLQLVFNVMESRADCVFEILTKRSARMLHFISLRYGDGGAPGHIYLGVAVERQIEADARIPDLIEMRAASKFVSVFPLLGEIKIWSIPIPDKSKLKELKGVAVGEDPLRPANPDWTKRLIAEFSALNVNVQTAVLADAVAARGF